MAPGHLTTLAHALLGLVHQMPRSGYALMKVFQTTPMGQYSGSPGAIYPALRGLNTAGLIRGAVERPARGALRPRRVFRLTPKGRQALRRWLAHRVTSEDVAFRESELMLRFALMEGALGEGEIAGFLESFAHAVDEYVASIEPFLGTPGMTLLPTLALEGGIEGLRARAGWARRARRRIRSARRTVTRRKR